MKKNKIKVLIFGIASFLNDFGSDMILPIWPIFVTSFLGANMTILGVIDGLGDAFVSISQGVSGYISDRWKKRKIFIWTGYLMGSCARAGYAISAVWYHLIPFKLLDRGGKIRSAPRDAFVAELSTDQDRGTNFGILRAMDNLGALGGITFCIILYQTLGFRTLFMIAAIPSFIGALIIIFKIKEIQMPGKKLFKGINLRDLTPNFRFFIILYAIFSLGFFSYSFLILFATEFGYKNSFVPVFYLIFTAVASLASLPFGWLADKIGRKAVVGIAFITWALTCGLAIIAQHAVFIYVIFILYGLHKGSVEPVQKAFVSELSPSDFKASGLGGFQMIKGLCALPASMIAGLLWDTVHPRAPFYLSLVLTVIAGIMLIFVRQKKVLSNT